MPASPVSLPWGSGAVEVANDGGVSFSAPGLAPVRLRVSGLDQVYPVLLDEDAIEQEATRSGARLEQRVRSVESRCELRWVVDVPTDATAEPLVLDIEIAGRPGWVWPSGADGFLLVFADEPHQGVWLLRARQAELRLVGEEPFAVSLTGELPPGRRVVTVLVEQVADLSGVAAGLPQWFTSPVLGPGEEWSAPLADVGLVCEPPVSAHIEEESGLVNLVAPSGWHDVSLHTRRGVTDVRLEVAAPVGEVVLGQVVGADPAELDAAEALLVQRALAAGLMEDSPLWQDALDRFDWSRQPGLLAVAFGAERALVEGEGAMAEEALRRIHDEPMAPGFTRVRSLVTVAATALGVPVRHRLAGPSHGWARLESDLAAGERVPRALAGLEEILARMGEGLPGFPLGAGPLESALAVGLLEFVPESWPEAPRAAWVAQLTRQRLLAAYGAGQVPDAVPLAWLTLVG